MPVTRASSSRLALAQTNTVSINKNKSKSNLGDTEMTKPRAGKQRTRSPSTASSSSLAMSRCISSASSVSSGTGSTYSSVSSASSNSQSRSSDADMQFWRPVRGGTVAESDEEDGEDEDDNRSTRSRFGGCSSGSETRSVRDDGNKENIAPIRNISREDREREELTEQEEAVARRTRSGVARNLSLRRSVSSSDVFDSQNSNISSSEVEEVAPTPRAVVRRRALTRTQSSPVTHTIPEESSRKRGRGNQEPPHSSRDLRRRIHATPVSRTRAAITRSASSGSLLNSNTSNLPKPLDLPKQVTGEITSPRRRGTPAPIELPEELVTDDDASSNCGFISSQASGITAISSMFDRQSLYSGASGYGADHSTITRATTPCSDVDMPSPGDKIAPPPVEPEADAVTTAADLDTFLDEVKADAEANTDQLEYTNVYAHARTLLRYATTQEMHTDDVKSTTFATQNGVVGRVRERAQVAAFLSERFPSLDTSDLCDDIASATVKESHKSNCLYICGTPGTGKTALLKDTVSKLKQRNGERVSVAYINCVAVSEPRAIFGKILKALSIDCDESADNEARLVKALRESKTNSVVLLDEIDSLLESAAHQNILYKVFMLASNKTKTDGNTAIIGIANSLDLTEKFLPLLAAQGREPSLINFQPFVAEEIIAIIKDRLKALHPRYDLDHAIMIQEEESVPGMEIPGVAPTNAPEEIPIFTPAALKLAATKVAAVTGDIRRGLDACRLAIEAVENEQRKKALEAVAAAGAGSSTQHAYTPQKLLAEWTPSTAPKVGPQHVLKVLSAVIGSPNLNKIRALSLHAKFLLAAYSVARQRYEAGLSVLGTMEAGFARQGVPFGVGLSDLETTYRKMLATDGCYTSLESSEVLSVLESLETQGIIEIGQPQNTSLVGKTAGTAGSRSGALSAAAKRSVKKQLLASDRVVTCRMPLEDVAKGLTTASMSSTLASGAGQASSVSVEAVRAIMDAEETRIERSRGWEQIAEAQQKVRAEELGGGRGAFAVGI